eukprot:7836504-Pyramimonas_sp.AAC.2
MICRRKSEGVPEGFRRGTHQRRSSAFSLGSFHTMKGPGKSAFGVYSKSPMSSETNSRLMM